MWMRKIIGCKNIKLMTLALLMLGWTTSTSQQSNVALAACGVPSYDELRDMSSELIHAREQIQIASRELYASKVVLGQPVDECTKLRALYMHY
jgi:hypothetical protein